MKQSCALCFSVSQTVIVTKMIGFLENKELKGHLKKFWKDEEKYLKIRRKINKFEHFQQKNYFFSPNL